jgi:hypothetical protein
MNRPNNSKVNWKTQAVVVRVKKTTNKALAEIARRIRDQARANIESNGQVDSGFMRDSGYVVTKDGTDYDQTPASGVYQSGKTGRQVKRTRGDVAPLPADMAAVVGNAASHAIFREVDNSFLYRAAEQVVSEVDGIIEHIARQELGD